MGRAGCRKLELLLGLGQCRLIRHEEHVAQEDGHLRIIGLLHFDRIQARCRKHDRFTFNPVPIQVMDEANRQLIESTWKSDRRGLLLVVARGPSFKIALQQRTVGPVISPEQVVHQQPSLGAHNVSNFQWPHQLG